MSHLPSDPRRKLASELLELEHSISGAVAAIEATKSELRELANAAGKGFSIAIAGQGEVKVSAGAKATFRGMMPILHVDVFMGLTGRRQKALAEDGIVTMDACYTRDTKPSVRVQLAAAA